MYQVENFRSLQTLNDWLREYSDRIEPISLSITSGGGVEVYLLFRVK
jgi:hypothetical protein